MRNSLFIVVALIAAAGCGSADEHPLGGPYGGSSNGAPTPTKGSTTGPDNSSPGDDGTGTPGTTGTPPGNTGTPPGTTPPNGTSDPPDAGNTTTPPPADDAGTTPPVTATDSGTTPPPPPPPPPPAAPTWTAIVNAYLKSGTVGNCGASGCHSQMNSPSSAYTWLGNKGYKGAAIADPQRSPMSWYGGNMPPQGPSSNAKATADMNAWSAAGALNN